jgi:thioredoxin 1
VATIELTKDNFEETVLNNDMVIVDFWAEWCGPCKMFGPVFETVSGEHDDVVFGKVDTEAQPELAGYFGIRSIPTLMVFRDQIGIYSQPGALPEPAFRDIVTQAKALDMDDVRAQIAAESEAEGESAGHDHAGHDHAGQDHAGQDQLAGG